jgi:hypothetical protein
MMGPTMKPKISAAMNIEIFLTRLSVVELIDIIEPHKKARAEPERLL